MILLAIFTFPGVMVHEMSHYWMCQLMQVKVYEVKLFTLSQGGCIGYVKHEKIQSLIKCALVAVAPFFFSTSFATLILTTIIVSPMNHQAHTFLTWLGFSIAFWAFPSEIDSESFFESNVKELRYNILTYLLLPFSITFKIASMLNRLCYITSIGMIFVINYISEYFSIMYLNFIK